MQDFMTEKLEKDAKKYEEQCSMSEDQHLIELYLETVKIRAEQKIKIAKLEKEISVENRILDVLNKKVKEAFRQVKDKL